LFYNDGATLKLERKEKDGQQVNVPAEQNRRMGDKEGEMKDGEFMQHKREVTKKFPDKD